MWKRLKKCIGRLQRTDFGAGFCAAIVVACLALNRWPGFAVLALSGAIFCLVVPRMEGRFGFKSGPTQVFGTFSKVKPETVAGTPRPPLERRRAPQPAWRPPSQSSNKEPDSD
jgi:hypothetical protein